MREAVRLLAIGTIVWITGESRGDVEWEYSQEEGWNQQEWYDRSDWLDDEQPVRYYDSVDSNFGFGRKNGDVGYHDDFRYDYYDGYGSDDFDHDRSGYEYYEDFDSEYVYDYDFGEYNFGALRADVEDPDFYWETDQSKWMSSQSADRGTDDDATSGANTGEAAPAQLSGNLVRYRAVDVEGIPPSNVVLRFDMNDGSSQLVDIGMGTMPGELGLDRGDEVTIGGKKRLVNGRMILVAREVIVDGDHTLILNRNPPGPYGGGDDP